MATAACLAAAGVLPTSGPEFAAVWEYVMPLGAALCLIEVDLTDIPRLWQSVGPTAVAYGIGAVGVVAGTLLGWLLLGSQLGADGSKVAAALCASFVGGSINFAATAAALGLAPGKLLAAAMAADNIAMALYLAVISSWPVGPLFAVQTSGATAAFADISAAAQSAVAAGGSNESNSSGDAIDISGSIVATGLNAANAELRRHLMMLGAAIPAAAVACYIGRALAEAAGLPAVSLCAQAAMATVIAAAASTALGRRRPPDAAASAPPFEGSSVLGRTLMLPFFATIGAAAGSLDALSRLGPMFCFILVQLTVHVAVTIAGGRLLRLPMDAVLTASNANIGGPATAAATASSRAWPHMVQPAVLLGSLGYAVGTAIGCAMGKALTLF